MNRLESSIAILEILPMLKKGYTDKSVPQIQIELEHIERNICPFCLNQINWKNLEKLIAKYDKELEVVNKLLKEINNKRK